jgi:IclR family transcriptional regulator, acetate operon repressor
MTPQVLLQFPFYGKLSRFMKIQPIDTVVHSSPERQQSDVPERTSVRAVHRALQLLNCFAQGRPALTLSEYARMTELPISTVSRLLTTLEAEGMVRRNPNGSYVCGTRLLQIGLTALQTLSIYDLAEPHLHRLTEVTGESAYLGISGDDKQIVYVRQSVSRKPIRHSAWLGRSVPRDGTAIGAAMAGRVGPEGFVLTRRTIEPDVTAIAAPVHGSDQSIVAAVNVVGPTYRIGDDEIASIGRAVVEAANAISLELGARLLPDMGQEQPAG